MSIIIECAMCGEGYNSDEWVDSAGTCQDCACDMLESDNAALRARVEKLERVREAADAVIKEMREEGTSRLRELFGFYTCDCFANLDAALVECPEVPRG